MGKKRIAAKNEQGGEGVKRVSEAKSGKKFLRGIAHIRATYNNTAITFSDEKGNVVASSSAGALGFSFRMGAGVGFVFQVARPGDDRAFADREIGVRNDARGIDLAQTAETLAPRTCAEGTVE